MPNYPYNPSMMNMPTYASNGTNVWPNYYSQVNDARANYQIPQMPMNSYAPPQVKSNIKWVSGRGEAESTPVGPNETILMLDSSTTKMYIKSAGPDGRINPLMVCDYTVSEAEFQNGNSQTAPQIDTSQFATKEDFNQLKKMLEDMNKAGRKNG